MDDLECPLCLEEKELIIKYQCELHEMCENCFNAWQDKNKRKCHQCHNFEIKINKTINSIHNKMIMTSIIEVIIFTILFIIAIAMQ